MRVGVIGGGALGLAAAWRIALAGHHVTVIEAEPAVGGLAVNFAIGGNALERFYHHIFGTDRRIIALIDELGLRHRLIWGAPLTSVRIGGRSYPLNSASAVLRFPLLSPFDRLRMGAAIAFLKALPSPEPLERFTALDWLRRAMGDRAVAIIWEPQLRGKMGAYADDVAMPWFWARVHDRTTNLGYLRGGFGQLYERLADRLRERGALVRVGERVRRIGRSATGPTVATDHRVETFDHLIVTLPTALFLRLAPDLPADYRARYATAAPHLGAHNVVLGLSRPLQEGYWVSICEPNWPFLVLVEHTVFLPPRDYDNLHVLYLGNYLPHDHRYFALDDEATLAELLPALRRFNASFAPDWVRTATVNRAPFAQPVVTRGYRERQPPFATPWPDVWLANMGMVYPHDRGQNYSVLLGEQVADAVLAAPRAPHAP